MKNNYKKLIVWQKAMKLTVLVYKLVKKLPKEELYALSDQMRHSVVSIPSNIAESQERNTDKEISRFLSFSLGSKAELETQLLIGQDIGYFSEEDISQALSLCSEIGKMLYTMIKQKSEDEVNPLMSEVCNLRS